MPHQSRPRRSQGSRTAILRAATDEFAERGFDGVRMEHVAARAGFNKALVYKHFTDREGLFEAVLDAAFAGRSKLLKAMPDSLADILVMWSAANRAEPGFVKLMMREALNPGSGGAVRQEERRAYYAAQIAMVERLQGHGHLPPELEPKYLFLALLAIVTLPAMLPQITELVTEEPPGSDGWHAFLRAFAAGLGATSGAKA